MKYIKKVTKGFIYSLLSFLVLLFLFTFLNYFGIINYKIMNIFKVVIPLLSIFIGAFVIGKSSSKKGYIEGIKFGLICIILLIIINLIFSKIIYKDFIFYILLLICSILGSTLGINKKID